VATADATALNVWNPTPTKQPKMNKNTLCLWYTNNAEEAAHFYAKTFPNSTVGKVHRAPKPMASKAMGSRLHLTLQTTHDVLPRCRTTLGTTGTTSPVAHTGLGSVVTRADGAPATIANTSKAITKIHPSPSTTRTFRHNQKR
jgi:hypothetical protein